MDCDNCTDRGYCPEYEPGGPCVKDRYILRYGDVLKTYTFDTESGCYTIRIIRYDNDLYIHKMLNGVVIEVDNLSETP